MGTVTVGSDRQKPTSHASALRNWGFLPGAAEVGFFRSYPDRTPHDSRGRNWGRSELNRESDTPKGTGQLPACELVGWLYRQNQIASYDIDYLKRFKAVMSKKLRRMENRHAK